ncbi:MAG: nucleotidyl transferase AbiEii/AbiGii toxin family protein [Flavobacteriales bacterium]
MTSREKAIHKAQLYRLLVAIADNESLNQHIAFKGGTCASMLGFLNRFSVDLDFDLLNGMEKQDARKILHSIFDLLELQIKDESDNALQFFLKYEAPPHARNSLKLEILDKNFHNNTYALKQLSDIDRMLHCQTIETMFANKLVAVTARYEKNGKIAGRDLYDICHYMKRGYSWNNAIITERTNMDAQNYLKNLHDFIKEKVNQNVIDQDLNTLLDAKTFQKVRKTLKTDLLLFLDQVISNE